MEKKELEEKRRQLWFMCALSILTTDERIAEKVAEGIVSKIRTEAELRFVIETLRNWGKISKEEAERLLAKLEAY